MSDQEDFQSRANDLGDPDALVACFYRDPWWEDLTVYINQKFRHIRQRSQPLSTTLVMNANLSKLELFEIGANSQSVSPVWNHIFAICSSYVHNWHQIYHKNVPEGLAQLYAVSLWIDTHTFGHILYHDDLRWLEVFLHERLRKRHYWANIMGESEIDFTEYAKRYLIDIPTSLCSDTGVLLHRKPDLRADILLNHLMIENHQTTA